MDVSLKVLAGAKVAVRKKQFVIGRAAECHLHVGTTSISRKHCVIRRDGKKVTIEDLKSRNGTLVNGKKIDRETELAAGDEISLGPLTLQVRISTGLNNEKKAKVQSVAEAIERTADQAGDIGDDDISSWLLGPATPSTAMKETQAMQFDETNVLDSSVMKEEADAQAEATSTGSDVLSDDEEEQGEEADESSKSKKKGPGKLPFRPEKPQAKDSVEAAQMALRNWSRRR